MPRAPVAAARASWYDGLVKLVIKLFGHAPAAGRRDLKRELALRAIGIGPKRPRKKPPEAGIAVPAIPPRGPLPLQGGAEAPLEFRD